MKTTALIPFVILPLLFACLPKKPEIPMIEAPAEPVVESLGRHRQSFATLKALGSIRAVRKDRRRSFENAGILVNGESQFRIEAYGPLGQALLTVLWDGKEILLDMAGERRLIPSGSSGLERLLGAEVPPADLCAILSGNVPGILDSPRSRMFCSPNGSCSLELVRGDVLVKVLLPPGWDPSLSIPSYEVHRGRTLIYRVRYESFMQVSGYLLPVKIIVENTAKRVSLTVEYDDVEVNLPLDDRSFSLSGAGGADQ